MSKPRLKQFVTASVKLGGGSVILAILLFSISIVEHIRNQNVAAYSLVFIAALFFCVGTYLAWSEERDQYEREVATNAKPDLQLELLAAFWDPTRIPGTNELQLNIYAYMRVTNLREPETLIKSGSLS